MSFFKIENTLMTALGKETYDKLMESYGIFGVMFKPIIDKNWTWENPPLELRVIQEDGIEVTPDLNISYSKMGKGSNGYLYRNFNKGGDGGIQFKIKVIIGKDETWHSKDYRNMIGKSNTSEFDFKVTALLDAWIQNLTPLKVVTDAIDIPNGLYIISDNGSRKQEYFNYTVWELEFTTYRSYKTYKFKNNNAKLKKAIKSSTSSKVSSKSKSAKQITTYQSKLKKCKRSSLVYISNKKTVTCVKYLQKILNKKNPSKLTVDGWYGKETVKAVKKFQKKYAKKYSLKETGKVDAKTFKAILKV